MSRFSQRGIAFLVVLGVAVLMAPYASATTSHAQSLFSLKTYISVAPGCTGESNARLAPKRDFRTLQVSCPVPGMFGVDIDPLGKVVYALDEANQKLIRIDENTDRVNDTFALPSCGDPRRPAVSRATGSVKIYIGCEDQNDILVLRVNSGRFGSITVVKRISLTIPGITDTFEVKTERINDKNSFGKLYVVGDENSESTIGCSDPAFVISTFSDSILASNTNLGTVASSDCAPAMSHTGINDVAIGASSVLFFNEDDQSVYRTDPMLNFQAKSSPVRADCTGIDGSGAEDAPKFGAVIGNQILATAPEALSPCGSVGAFYTLNGTTLNASIPVPGFAAGAVAAAGQLFLVADQSEFSAANCTPTCVDVVSTTGAVLQSVPLARTQNDVVFDPLAHKAYLTLDSNGSGQDIAVLQ